MVVVLECLSSHTMLFCFTRQACLVPRPQLPAMQERPCNAPTSVSTTDLKPLPIPPLPPHSHDSTKPCSAVGEGGVTMLKPPASPLPGQMRRKERASSSSASTCAGGIVFWSTLAGAFYLLNCWSGVRVDEASETQSVFSSRLRRHEESSRPRYQVLATALRPSRRQPEPAAAPPKDDSWVWQRRKRAFDSPAERACTVFCEGELLQAVQLAGIFQDSKEFVDMPMRVDPEIILDKFNTLTSEAKQDKYILSQFVNEHFLPPGSELVAIQPQDFTDTPSVLSSLTPNSTYYGWAQYLNQAFASLTRKVSEDVFLNPQRYSILRRTHPVVIPGGRFRESYYWDSHWIVLGLLACDMKETARGLVQNLLDDVANFGFVPNGGRIYYLNRSQPPLLSEMVLALLEADEALMKDVDFVSQAVSLLDSEYAFWMREGEHAVKLEDKDEAGTTHLLNRYWTSTTYPRPESYKEDLSSHTDAPVSAKLYGGVYANIAAGAESGWDFSSRWIVPGVNNTYDLSDIETSNILPVELNAYLYRMERNLARLHELQATAALPPLAFVATNIKEGGKEGGVGTAAAAAAAVLSVPKAIEYSLAADRRAVAMDKYMWDSKGGMWVDHVVSPPPAGRAAPGKGVMSASNFIPLWAGLTANPLVKEGEVKAARAVEALKGSGLVQVGGCLTTARATEEQWDGPNAWPPLQQLMIEGLERTGLPEGVQLAEAIAKAWLESNFLGWTNSGYMHEKYNGMVPGARGEGGEYYPQVGFGWTNGVVLHLLKTYGDKWTGVKKTKEGGGVPAVVETTAAGAAVAAAGAVAATNHTPSVDAPVVELNEKNNNNKKKIVQEEVKEEGKAEVEVAMPERSERVVEAKEEDGGGQ